MRANPIDDQSNHHLPIASLQATVANIMGGTRRLTDFLIFKDREVGDMDSEIASLLASNDFDT